MRIVGIVLLMTLYEQDTSIMHSPTIPIVQPALVFCGAFDN